MSKWFLDNLKQHFVCICCITQFNPKTEDSSSDKKLEHCLPHSIEAGLDLTKKVDSDMRDSIVFIDRLIQFNEIWANASEGKHPLYRNCQSMWPFGGEASKWFHYEGDTN